MSPALFNIYIKEVVDAVDALQTGIWLDGMCFSVLVFADDLVFIGEYGNHFAPGKGSQTKYFYPKVNNKGQEWNVGLIFILTIEKI